MSLFAIADLHLSIGVNKPMDIFGGWKDYQIRLLKNWNDKIRPDDTVVIAGDICWAITTEQGIPDFAFLHALPGKKIILKGNHDYWFSTRTKVESFFTAQAFDSLSILYNNALFYENYAICGTRGWINESGEAPDRKVLRREAGRLERSLQAAGDKEPIVFLHYPPLFLENRCEEILEVLHRFPVRRVYYGHLHGKSCNLAFNGIREGIEYHLISADFLRFDPVQVL
ncbi:MAG TPA: metallophosphoesterase [Firmicutes bacterium]|nr:metallophosphoesterase [Bacillota bacterium]